MLLTNSAQLRNAVAGFVQRDPSVFLRGTDANAVDLLYVAINNARLYAERKVDFELAVVSVAIPNVSLPTGGQLTDAVLASNLAVPVRVKKIRTPYLPLWEGSTDINKCFPVDLMSKKKWDDRVKQRWEGAHPRDRADFAYITDSPFCLVQSGNTVFIAPPDARIYHDGNLTVYADVIAWLPNYVDGTENDFLLDNCFDWLMYRSVQELNFYLKEDERVQISATLVNDAWNSLVTWNNELMASAVDDTNLD